MTPTSRSKEAAQHRTRYWRDPEHHRAKARARKTLILIERARIEALRMLRGMVVA